MDLIHSSFILFLLNWITASDGRKIMWSPPGFGMHSIFPYSSMTLGYRSGGHPKFSPGNTLYSRGLHGDNSSPQCGQRTVQHESRTSRIIGGSLVPYGAYPWMANVKLKYGTRSHHQCGGAIVDSHHIVTAAHCLVANSPNEYEVTLGDDDRDSLDDEEQTFEVESFKIHPKFTKNAYPGDLAVLKLKSKNGKGIKSSNRVSSACLPTPETSYRNGTWCTVAGWGTTDNNDPPTKSKRLRAASIPLISTDICRERSLNGHKLDDGMICAGFLSGSVDACVGDSGGPLVCEENGVYNLLGVVSWGDGCAAPSKPGVYTNIQYYLKWIKETIDTL